MSRMIASWATMSSFSNNVMLAGHCRVGDYVIIGGGAGVHQYVRIGDHAFIGAMSGIANDVIPYGMAVGDNRAGQLSGLEYHRSQAAWLQSRAGA